MLRASQTSLRAAEKKAKASEEKAKESEKKAKEYKEKLAVCTRQFEAVTLELREAKAKVKEEQDLPAPVKAEDPYVALVTLLIKGLILILQQR